MMGLYEIFQKARPGGTVTVPSGEYVWDGREIPLCDKITVLAYGAIFSFPKVLPAPHVRMFVGENVRDITWRGGIFRGYVYDPAR